MGETRSGERVGGGVRKEQGKEPRYRRSEITAIEIGGSSKEVVRE